MIAIEETCIQNSVVSPIPPSLDFQALAELCRDRSRTKNGRKALVAESLGRTVDVPISTTQTRLNGMIGVALIYAATVYGIGLADLSFSFGYGLGAVVNLAMAAWIVKRKPATVS